MRSLKKILLESDVYIYGHHIPQDPISGGYNIGDLLNMPFLGGSWSQQLFTDKVLERTYLIADEYPDSILSIYCRSRPKSESVPNIPRIVESVKKYRDMNLASFKKIDTLVQSPECLCVHVRSGDIDVEQDFITLISKLSEQYETVVIFSGILLFEKYRKSDAKKRYFLESINQILGKNTNIYIYLDNPDEHFCLMSVAHNLLLHQGGFSALGYIISTKNLFITKYFTHRTSNAFTENVEMRHILLDLPYRK